MKNELQDVLSGKSEVRYGTIIQSITHYLKNGTPASEEIKSDKHYKKQETARLEDYLPEKTCV